MVKCHFACMENSLCINLPLTKYCDKIFVIVNVFKLKFSATNKYLPSVPITA